MAFRNSYSGYPCGSGTSWSRTVQSKELPWFSSALECFDTRGLVDCLEDGLRAEQW